MNTERDIHELVGLAKLLVRMGFISREQAVNAMNISFIQYEQDGWPREGESGNQTKEVRK